MKNNQGLLVVAVVASIAFCFLNELRYALIVLVLAYWFINDYKATSKVMQPIMIWVSARVVLSFFTFILSGISDLIAAFANKWNNIDAQILKFISPIATLWIGIFLTLCIFFFLKNKDVPLYGKFANDAAKFLHAKRNGVDVEEEKVVLDVEVEEEK